MIESNQPIHRPGGWDFEKVDAILRHITYILQTQNLTFVEQKFIIAWIECDYVYEVGKRAAYNTIQDLMKGPEDYNSPVRGQQYG